jgi:GAF domain.
VWIGALDITEQYGARQRLTLLNEAGTHVGTTLDVTRTAQELADMVVPRLADLAVVDLLDAVLSGDEPRPGPLAGTIALRRVAHQSIFGGVPEAVVEPGDVDIHPESFPSARCLATGKAVLTGAGRPDVHFVNRPQPGPGGRDPQVREFHSVLSVPIRARGVTLGVAVFPAWSRPEPFRAGRRAAR